MDLNQAVYGRLDLNQHSKSGSKIQKQRYDIAAKQLHLKKKIRKKLRAKKLREPYLFFRK